ncbi:MAG: bifunctional demethylmenaquinone methyltransferase/2-methoxy-6-polyprenyl-1,4-benzoquinol methylase UbiE [Bacteroidota bacterium]
MEVKPYKEAPGNRKEQIIQMFDSIAGRYDFLNHLLSFNQDKKWRKKLVDLILSDLKRDGTLERDFEVIDVATGTGDLAFGLSGNPRFRITGLDISTEMLKIASKKAKKRQSPVSFVPGDSESLPFKDHTFDIATVAFGVRNFENLQKGLREIVRVLKNHGKLYILEFSKPRGGILSRLYGGYSDHMLPFLAGVFGGERQAYKYLPESIANFPSGDAMLTELEKAGSSQPEIFSLNRGVALIYKATVIK